MAVLIILIILAVLLLLTVLVSFNCLSDSRQQIRDAWGGMDRQLKARYALLSQLISASGSLNPRPAVIDEIMAAKNQAAVAFDPRQLAAAETSLTRSVRRLPALPDPQIEGVRHQLTASETVIGQAVARYNDRVHGFNSLLESFPNSLIGRVLGFAPEAEFHAGEV